MFVSDSLLIYSIHDLVFVLKAAVSQVGPSPVFPIGLPPSKQSEIQLNNVELEGKVNCSLLSLVPSFNHGKVSVG